MTALTEAAVMALALACAPGLDPTMITGIARQESGLDPAKVSAPNVNGSRDIGLMQINERNFGWLHLTMESALNPCQSIHAAAQLFLSYSRYNTGSPIAGFHTGYVQSVVAAVAQAKVRAVSPIHQQSTLSRQITPFTSEGSR